MRWVFQFPPMLQGSVMGTCRFLPLLPPHPTHTPGQRVSLLSPEVSLGKCHWGGKQSVLAWELLERSLDVSVSPVEETLDSALSAVQAGSTREGGTPLGSSSLVSAGRKTPGP